MVRLIKHGLRSIARTSVFSRVVTQLEASADRRENLLRVLTYHRVDHIDTDPGMYPGTLSATPTEFAWQMDHLAEHCQVVDIRAVLSALRGESQLPPKAVLVTFDDAYADFERHAWPVLKKLALPALLFVPTAFPGERDRGFWWDRMQQAAHSGCLLKDTRDRGAFRSLINRVKQLPHSEAMGLVDEYCRAANGSTRDNGTLTWEQLGQLADDGLDLAAHTHSHPLMTRLNVDEAIEEAVRSRRELVRRVGVDLPVLAYPAGDYNEQVARGVERAGFEAAFTTRRGLNDLAMADAMTLRRINVAATTPRALLRAQLLPTMRHFDAVWKN